MAKNEYEKMVDQRAKKISKYKKFFKSRSIKNNEFKKKIDQYYNIYKSFMIWRKNFDYPELNYLSRLKTLKPEPSDDLIKDLSNSVSELKDIYLDLKDYRAIIIFKLFLYYVTQCLKAKLKIKFNNSRYFGSGAVDLDIDSTTSTISSHFLNIKTTKEDPKATKYSCECGKYKKKPKDENFKCENKKCHGYIQKLNREPWYHDPWSFTFGGIGPLNRVREYKEYKKFEKEIKNLLNIKNKTKILNIKYAITSSFLKITPNELIVEYFFRLDFHHDNEKIEKIVFNKTIETNDNLEKRTIISKDKNNLELYWGDLQNGKPHGKGVSEKYETNEANKKVSKTIIPTWWKKYSKNLNAKDLKGYIITEKYEGQWENGKKNGKGDLIIFADPAFYSNKDWTPAISERYKGIFKENELDGQIKEFDDISKKWTLKNYKNGVVKK